MRRSHANPTDGRAIIHPKPQIEFWNGWVTGAIGERIGWLKRAGR